MLITLLAATLLSALCARTLGWLPGSDALWLASGLTSTAASLFVQRARPGLGLLCTWTAATCWGAVLAPVERDAPPPQGGLARVSVSVARGGCGERGCYAEAGVLRCHALEERACVPVGTRIGIGSDHELPAGARLSALMRLRPRVRFDNPGDVASWPDTRPTISASVQRGARPRLEHLSWLEAALAEARTAIRQLLERTLAAPHAGIARALLLGEGSAVDPELNAAIRNAGVSHVLAVSGMHVTLLVGAWVTALRRLWLFTPLALHWEARRAGAVLGVLLSPLLARLCGASPSASRAAWTSMLMYFVCALGLRPAPLPVAALVVGGFAALEPREALHPGFVLSVLATAALLGDLGSSRTSTWLRALRESARAWLATMPFLVLCFGQVSLVALLANVALLPLGSALVPLAAAHLLGAVSGLELLTSTPFSLASGAFVEAARIGSSLDPGLTLPPPSAVQSVALAGFALSWLLPLRAQARLWVAGLALAAIGSAEWSLRHSLAPDALRVTFLDVGQGDATLLESGAGPTMLIDAGGALGAGPDPGALSVLPALRARRITKLDRVVLSHPHPDHYGGLPAVLAALPVRELWDTGQARAEHDTGEVADLLQQARAEGARLLEPAALCGAPLAFGISTLEVLAPCPGFDFTRGANDNSFVIRVSHGQTRFLLTGDIEHDGETALLGQALQSDVLKVGHHGSRSSSTPAFLDAVSPSLAIVSAGRGNRFGHPHPEVSARLSQRARVLRTDQRGGIEIVSDGRVLSFRTAH
jgi:competence protein ComEC